MSWAERTRERVVRRAVHRIALLEAFGDILPIQSLVAQYLAASRDVVYAACLYVLFPRESGAVSARRERRSVRRP